VESIQSELWDQFCGCSELYDAYRERGTMYQCLGLGSVEDGGWEDCWHLDCVVGLSRERYKDSVDDSLKTG